MRHRDYPNTPKEDTLPSGCAYNRSQIPHLIGVMCSLFAYEFDIFHLSRVIDENNEVASSLFVWWLTSMTFFGPVSFWFYCYGSIDGIWWESHLYSTFISSVKHYLFLKLQSFMFTDSVLCSLSIFIGPFFSRCGFKTVVLLSCCLLLLETRCRYKNQHLMFKSTLSSQHPLLSLIK